MVIETPRLRLRHMTTADAAVILAVLNDPAFLAFVGDKGVRTVEQARAYLETGPIAMYAHRGFGQYLAELRETGTPVGICGLIKRDALPHADVGFALFPAFRGQGFAFEAASAVLDHARGALGMSAVLAITHQENVVSQRLLEKLGLRFERLVDLPSSNGRPREAPLKLYAISWSAGA